MNPPILRLTKPTKCCGAKLVVFSAGIFDKRNKGKYICPCGRFKKSVGGILAFQKEP